MPKQVLASHRLRVPHRLRSPKPHKPPRPKMQIATLAATLLLIALFSLFSHGNSLLSYATIRDAMAPADEHMRPARPRPNLSAAVRQQQPTVIVAADGSRFQIGAPHPFSMLALNDSAHLVLNDVHQSLNIGTRHANLAFFLQISQATLPLLPRLLVILWHPHNIYVIHLDSKIADHQANAFRDAVVNNAKFSNVHLLEREPITYKGVSMLLNTLSAIEYLLQTDSNWDYFINLSGSDYPLVNVGTMRRLLGARDILDRRVSFLQIATSKEFWERMRHSRFDFIYYDTALGMKNMSHQLLNTWQRQPVKDDVGVQFVQAEAWIIAHRSFAEFSVRSSFSRKLLILLSAMQDPEEHFFPMLAWNNRQWNATLAHHAFRGIFWDLNGTMSGQHPYYVDQVDERNGEYKFWNAHIRGCRGFFARKFAQANSALMERIDRQLSGTHAQADRQAVRASLGILHKYVSCVADIQPHSAHIRSYNVCR